MAHRQRKVVAAPRLQSRRRSARRLIKALRRTFGRHTPIQRCQVHKARNIVERLRFRCFAQHSLLIRASRQTTPYLNSMPLPLNFETRQRSRYLIYLFHSERDIPRWPHASGFCEPPPKAAGRLRRRKEIFNDARAATGTSRGAVERTQRLGSRRLRGGTDEPAGASHGCSAPSHRCAVAYRQGTSRKSIRSG